MLKFEKNGKKLMEITDNGDVTIYDGKLSGVGELKEEAEKENDTDKE
jgi:hypothetical protein